jgi:hypothetical protein
MKHPKFGDRIEGVHAGHNNPQKFGTFVCVVRRPHGVVNSGTFYRVTDKNGNFWEYPYASCINHGNERESAVAKLVEALEGIVALDVAHVGLMRGMLINPSDERDYYSPLANIARSALDEFHGRKQG